MYSWIWRRLPGGVAGKLLGVAVLIAGAVVALFLVVFPWASPRLPFNHVTVDGTTSPQPSSTAPAVPD
jgi:hypothetical protein